MGGDGSPVSRTVLLDVGDEDDVFFGSPWTFLNAYLVAARRPPHGERERGEFRLGASCCLSRDEAFLAAYIEGEGVDFC